MANTGASVKPLTATTLATHELVPTYSPLPTLVEFKLLHPMTSVVVLLVAMEAVPKPLVAAMLPTAELDATYWPLSLLRLLTDIDDTLLHPTRKAFALPSVSRTHFCSRWLPSHCPHHCLMRLHRLTRYLYLWRSIRIQHWSGALTIAASEWLELRGTGPMTQRPRPRPRLLQSLLRMLLELHWRVQSLVGCVSRPSWSRH